MLRPTLLRVELHSHGCTRLTTDPRTTLALSDARNSSTTIRGWFQTSPLSRKSIEFCFKVAIDWSYRAMMEKQANVNGGCVFD